jgi:hypothetical protein
MKCECTKKNFFDYFILLFLFTLDSMLIFSSSLLNENKDSSTSILMMLSENLSSKEGIEIIFLTLVSFLLLKHKYFIHHYFAIGAFIILTLVIDFMLKNFESFSKKNLIEIFINIIIILAEVIYLCYTKYMIDKQFRYYWNIMFFIGISLAISNTLAVIIILITPRERASSFFIEFWDYFDSVPVGIIISKFIIFFILELIFNILRILTIFYLSPEYMLITTNLSKIYVILAKNPNDNKYYCIIFFILQIFSLMIYLEILELNFCGLNQNTKRSIQSRELDDFVERNDTYQSGNGEINGEYIVETHDQQENDSEMKLVP